MKIEHIGLWTRDIERLCAFYVTYFGAQAGPGYHNPSTGFRSTFLTFSSGARLEVMQRPDVGGMENTRPRPEDLGYAHLAFSVGSETIVRALTEALVEAGYERIGGPRRTGDGYFESVILDPDGNRVEITA